MTVYLTVILLVYLDAQGTTNSTEAAAFIFAEARSLYFLFATVECQAMAIGPMTQIYATEANRALHSQAIPIHCTSTPDSGQMQSSGCHKSAFFLTEYSQPPFCIYVATTLWFHKLAGRKHA